MITDGVPCPPPHRSGLIQSVDRALSILECFILEREELGISELARLLSLNKSTTFGLVQTLEAKGYLEQDRTTGRYRIGLKVLDLANARLGDFDFTVVARPFLRQLADKLKETIHLGVYDRGEVVYVDKITSGDNAIQIATYIGKRNPCYCTSVGKCLLAFQPEAEVERVIAMGLPPRTNRTITDAQALQAALAHVREVDQAIDDEEFENGLVCVSAPIRDRTGEVRAALSASFPSLRVGRDKMIYIAKEVEAMKVAISQALGYKSF